MKSHELNSIPMNREEVSNDINNISRKTSRFAKLAAVATFAVSAIVASSTETRNNPEYLIAPTAIALTTYAERKRARNKIDDKLKQYNHPKTHGMPDSRMNSSFITSPYLMYNYSDALVTDYTRPSLTTGLTQAPAMSAGIALGNSYVSRPEMTGLFAFFVGACAVTLFLDNYGLKLRTESAEKYMDNVDQVLQSNPKAQSVTTFDDSYPILSQYLKGNIKFNE
ncbi:MAG: hypothetical protein WCF91_00550 [bacterium]